MPFTPKQQRFYVYTLTDPRDDEVFYVGKGSGKRSASHVAAARTGRSHNPLLASRILDIQHAGLEPIATHIREHLTQAEAFDAERAEMAQHASLCNISPGSWSFEARQQARARALIRRMKPISQVFNPEARVYHRAILKQLARLVACPEPEWLTSNRLSTDA